MMNYINQETNGPQFYVGYKAEAPDELLVKGLVASSSSSSCLAKSFEELIILAYTLVHTSKTQTATTYIINQTHDLPVEKPH